MFSAVRLPWRTRDSACQHVAAPSFEGDGMRADAHQKIKPTHLKRTAYLYIRQSTLRQLFENVESTQRQYALRQHAIALGWQQEQIVVIDSDLGQSGASAADREGFQRLVTEVSLGHAGIVLGLEVSRLARNSMDWHRLLEICALSDTLILDEDGVYDPAHFNDRLLLGLKGTMSEAELHVLRARLQGGILNKARRGELFIRPPIGFAYDAVGRMILDPDQQIQRTIRRLFDTFQRTGSAMATVRDFRNSDVLFPRRIHSGPTKGDVIWGKLEHSQVLRVLHNHATLESLYMASHERAKVSTVIAEYNVYPGKNGTRSYRNLTRPILAGRSMRGTSSGYEKVHRRLVASAERARLAKARRCCRV